MSSNSVPLCRQILRNGRKCTQPALHGEQGCRHHMRPFRHDMYQITHEEAMQRLQASLEAMELPKLLLALQHKLNRIRSVVRRNPEAQLALDIALQRLQARNQASRSFEGCTPEELPDFSSPEGQAFMKNFIHAMR